MCRLQVSVAGVALEPRPMITLECAEDYSHWMVGDPSRSYLKVMAREPSGLVDGSMDALLQVSPRSMSSLELLPISHNLPRHSLRSPTTPFTSRPPAFPRLTLCTRRRRSRATRATTTSRARSNTCLTMRASGAFRRPARRGRSRARPTRMRACSRAWRGATSPRSLSASGVRAGSAPRRAARTSARTRTSA